jgi:hypothetical protein
LPFFKLLKKSDKFKWTDEADQALEELKTFLTTAPVMVPPAPKESFCSTSPCPPRWSARCWWLSDPKRATSTPVQRPIYYVSEVLSDSKVRYSQPQKLLYAI